MAWQLLSELPDADRRRVLAAARLRRFARGEVVFHQGDPGDTLHLIAKGRVAARTMTPLGEVATLAVLGRGDFFGELALVSPDARRSATVVALEPVETRAISRGDFEELERAHPSVSRFLAVVLAAQVRRLSRQVLDALYVPADERVMRRLGDLAEIYADEDRTVIPLTQEDLATMAGTSRATVNRVLRAAERQGILSIGRMKVEIVDRRRLAAEE